MNKKLLSSFIFLMACFSSSAFAYYIAGWGCYTGSVVTTIDLKNVPNPSTKPTIAAVDATLDQIEFLCVNPNDHSVAPGQAGQRTASTNQALTSGQIVDKKATVNLSFEVPGPFNCVNPNWTYIEDSAAAKQINITISYYECSGDPKTDADPCYDGNELTITTKKAAVVEGVCTINPVLRNDDYTVVKGQVYACTTISQETLK